MPTDASPQDKVNQEQVKVQWQHPRHELEKPVLLVWPSPLRENWAAEVLDDSRARVVCREVLVGVGTGESTEIEKYTERVDLPYDTIPQYVECALLDYDGNYGPISEVINKVDTEKTEIPDDPTTTLDAYFNKE